MGLLKTILSILGISFCYYGYVKFYSNIFKNNIKACKLNYIIHGTFIILITYYNTFYNYGVSKILISFLMLLIFFKLIFRENIKTIFLKSILTYIASFIVEMVYGMLLVYFNINSVISFDANVIYKVIFSALIVVNIIALSRLKFIQKINFKLYNLMNKLFNMSALMMVFMIIIIILAYYLIISNNVYSISAIIALLLLLGIIITICIREIIHAKKASDKEEILLNFMKEYEAVIDKERMERHEMVNNLLVLKMIKNKNTKSYDKTLDDIIATYQNNRIASNLYNLPPGLKGLFYYKTYDMKNKGIEVLLNISNKIIKDLDNMQTKKLTKLCKILGILLDNAKEAAYESKDKIIVIDMYEENNNIIIYIENTINNSKNITIEKIKAKGFSTKGINRGYGLYIIDSIIKNKTVFSLGQKINENKFISILTIKK